MPLQCVIQLTSLCVPNLGFLVKATSDNFVSERVVEGHGVNDIAMVIKGKKLFSCHCVPDFARAIV